MVMGERIKVEEGEEVGGRSFGVILRLRRKRAKKKTGETNEPKKPKKVNEICFFLFWFVWSLECWSMGIEWDWDWDWGGKE